MLQLRFFPVSQGTWVFVPVFIWIRADLSTCTNALLNHGLNFHAGHYPNPVENTHEAAANPSAQQRWNFSKNSVWRFILHILFSKTTFYHSCITANSWLTARGSFWLHMCMLREWRDAQVRCVTHPKPSESCRNAPSSVTWGTLASLRAGMKHCLPGAELDTAVTAGCSCGHSAAGQAGIRDLGSPRAVVDAWHTSLSDVFTWLGCELTGWTLPLCLLEQKLVGPRQRSSCWILVFVVGSKVNNTHWNPT